ncbi:MAG: hypothetical protein AAFU85_22260 [Planctomycetota bacterium]
MVKRLKGKFMFTAKKISTLTTVLAALAVTLSGASAAAQPPSSPTLNLQFPDENTGPGVPRGSDANGRRSPQGLPASPGLNVPGLSNPRLGGGNLVGGDLGAGFGRGAGIDQDDPTQPSTDMRRDYRHQAAGWKGPAR